MRYPISRDERAKIQILSQAKNRCAAQPFLHTQSFNVADELRSANVVVPYA